MIYKVFVLFVVQGDPLKYNMSLVILELEESGHLNQLRAKWWRSSCSNEDSSNQWSPVKLNEIGGALLLLAIGLSLALIIAGIELAIKSRKKADQDVCIFIISPRSGNLFPNVTTLCITSSKAPTSCSVHAPYPSCREVLK